MTAPAYPRPGSDPEIHNGRWIIRDSNGRLWRDLGPAKDSQ